MAQPSRSRRVKAWERSCGRWQRCWGEQCRGRRGLSCSCQRGLTPSSHVAVCAKWPRASPWPWWPGPCRAAAATRGGGGQPVPGGTGGLGVSDPAPGQSTSRGPLHDPLCAGAGWGPRCHCPRSEVPAASAAATPAPSRLAPGAAWGEWDTDWHPVGGRDWDPRR